MKISVILVLLLCSVSLFAQQASDNSWIPDNHVNHMTYGDNKIYIAGDFSWFGEPYTSSVAIFNPSLEHDSNYPVVAGPITQSIPDGDGGWFVASNYKITHIKSDKTIEELPFDFGNIGTAIRGIDKVGNTLYVVGQFTSVNGSARGYGASINLTNNTLNSWDPNSGGYIYCIKAVGSTIYVGGSFSSMGGQARAKIAALDATTGSVTSWNANVTTGSGFVYTIEATASAVYFGGSFSNVASGSPSRSNFAAVNTTTGALLAFNPRPNDDVLALLLDGNTLYLGGDFTQAVGVTRTQLAAVDITTGVATSFTASFPSPYAKDVYTLAVDGNKLFVGGNFTNINNTQKANLVVLNKVSGAIESTEERAVGGYVLTISISGGKVLVGGNLRGITGISNSYGLVALDGITGTGTNWIPDLPDLGSNAFLSDLQLHYQDNRVYYLAYVYAPSDGIVGVLLGALNCSDGSAIAGWPIEIDGEEVAWAFSDDALYIAGDFSEINGEDRNGFAAIDLSTGELLPWTLPITLFLGDGDQLYSLAYSNDAVYLTGEYSITVSGEDRNNFSAWDATTAELLEWNPEINPAEIGTIHDGKVYFTSGELFRVDAVTGDVDDWSPDFVSDGGVIHMLITGNDVYYAGYFSPGLVRVDIQTGEVSGTQPDLEDVYDLEGSVRALAVSSTKLYAGGSFRYSTATGPRSDYAEYLLGSSTNSAPEIQTIYRSIPIQGIIQILLTDIISDADGNVDFATLEITSGPASGAAAYIDGNYLIVDYSGLTFTGTDNLTLRVCDTESACAEEDITIELGGDIVVYNAVSANGDSKNDRFRIQNLEIFTNNKVTIFNRWGDVVFEIRDYNNDDRVFTGLNKNNKELPAGTYYYRIEYANKTKTGYLSLKR